jgi:biotin transport system substrate-specific component
MFSSTYPVLADQAFSGRMIALRNVVLAIAGSLALWLSAKLQVPFYPVPMTMQTFVVLVIGTAFGWRLGAATVALYLAEGALGLPVFAGTPEKGIGLAYMAGPTGGYLLGYFPAAALCGFLANRGWDRRIGTMALSMLLGTVVIYAFGLSWLGTIVGWDKPILAWGLTPFILGDLLKLALAAAVLPLAWKFVGYPGKGDR